MTVVRNDRTQVPLPRANFFHHAAVNEPGVVLIVDVNDGSMSVTNDAEAVVRYLYATGKIKNGDHLIYWDTEGVWDELVHKDGKFVGFHPLGEKEANRAVEAARTRGFKYE